MKVIKNYRRDYDRVYKDMSVTYGEFIEALIQLGFEDVSTLQRFRFAKPDNPNDILSLAIQPLDVLMPKAQFLAHSYNLYLHEDIEDPDDLAKTIEANREKAKEELALAVA